MQGSAVLGMGVSCVILSDALVVPEFVSAVSLGRLCPVCPASSFWDVASVKSFCGSGCEMLCDASCRTLSASEASVWFGQVMKQEERRKSAARPLNFLI